MILKPIELKVLEWSMPIGIISRRYLYGADDAETRNLRDAFSSLVKAGLLSEHVVFHDTTTGRDHKRYYITPKGFLTLVECLPEEHPLKYATEPCTIRSGLSSAGQKSIVRMADVKTVFAGLGVDDMYSLLANGKNPFSFFGPPTSDRTYKAAYDPSSPNYIDQVMGQMVQQARSTGMTMDFDFFGRSIFVPLRYMRAFPKPVNNALGVVLDFRDKTVYVVFKGLIDDPQKLFWSKRAYERMLFEPAYCAHKFTSTYAIAPRNALFFLDQVCSLPKLLDTVISQPPNDFPAPFGCILAIVLRDSQPDGIPLLRQVLRLGIKALYQLEQSYIMHCCPSLQCRYSDPTKLYDAEKEYYVGTIADLCQILNYLKRGGKDFWICYEDQVPLYGRYIPLDRIISIPRQHD